MHHFCPIWPQLCIVVFQNTHHSLSNLPAFVHKYTCFYAFYIHMITLVTWNHHLFENVDAKIRADSAQPIKFALCLQTALSIFSTYEARCPGIHVITALFLFSHQIIRWEVCTVFHDSHASVRQVLSSRFQADKWTQSSRKMGGMNMISDYSCFNSSS